MGPPWVTVDNAERREVGGSVVAEGPDAPSALHHASFMGRQLLPLWQLQSPGVVFLQLAAHCWQAKLHALWEFECEVDAFTRLTHVAIGIPSPLSPSVEMHAATPGMRVGQDRSSDNIISRTANILQRRSHHCFFLPLGNLMVFC